MRAVFIDRDGVICENRSDHVKSWEEFKFLPNSLLALSKLAKSEFAIVIVTNQAIIRRGISDWQTVSSIHSNMLAEIRRNGGKVDLIQVCPHRSNENCFCRKPRSGLLVDAASKLNIDLRRSYLIGDAMADIYAGHAVGCKCIMVLTGRGIAESSEIAQSGVYPHIADDLSKAVDMILDGFAT